MAALVGRPSWCWKSADIPHIGSMSTASYEAGDRDFRPSAAVLCAKTVGAGRNTQKLIRKHGFIGDFVGANLQFARLVKSTEECWSEKPVDTVQFRNDHNVRV